MVIYRLWLVTKMKIKSEQNIESTLFSTFYRTVYNAL